MSFQVWSPSQKEARRRITHRLFSAERIRPSYKDNLSSQINIDVSNLSDSNVTQLLPQSNFNSTTNATSRHINFSQNHHIILPESQVKVNKARFLVKEQTVQNCKRIISNVSASGYMFRHPT